MSCAPSCWRRPPPEEPPEVRVYTRGSRDSELEGNSMVATIPHYALKQARDAAYTGVSWLSRDETTPAAGEARRGMAIIMVPFAPGGGHAGRKPRDPDHVGG